MKADKGEGSMFEDRVAKGAALLDEHRPGWARLVALNRLAMETCDQCILGQVCGDYYDGWKKLLPRLPRKWHRSSDYGFTLAGEEQDLQLGEYGIIQVRFGMLADAWRAEIRRRLEAEGDRPHET
jgi:hypothetical protein